VNRRTGLLPMVTSLTLLSGIQSAGLEIRRPVATHIQEASFIKLGGIDQWVTIRGADRASPVLLIVHGGPGDPQSGLVSTYAIYEKDFTIVQWDQRGAGKTYGRNPTSPPEPERVEADGIELAQYLCDHLAKNKIIVLGHSWGSYLGIGM